MPVLRSCIFLLALLFAFGLPAYSLPQMDSSNANANISLGELQKLFLQNKKKHIEDSLRIVMLQEELSKVKNPQGDNLLTLQQEIQRAQEEDSLRLIRQREAIQALRLKTPGDPVVLHSDTLFKIYTPLGPFTSANRAEYASEKIYALYKKATFIPDSVVITRQQDQINILYEQHIITSINGSDALWAGQDLESLAMEYQKTIISTIETNRAKYNLQNILIHAGYAALVLIGLAFSLWLQNISFLKIGLWISKKKDTLFQGIKIKNYEILSTRHLQQFIRRVLAIIKTLVTILLVYFSLSLIFSFFPETENLTHTLLDWSWQLIKDIVLSLFRYLPNLIKIIVIILLTRYVLRGIHFFSLEIERDALHIKGFHPEWARPTYNIIRFLLYAFSFVIIFPYLPGSDSVAFKGVSVFLGILFSIGSSSAISNTVAGFVITYMRPFKTGDWIKVNDITGCVMEKTALVTRLRTINNEDVTIPNSAILANHTINYSSSTPELGLIITADVHIRYEEDWRKIHELLLEAAHKTTDVDTSEKPYIFQTTLNEQFVCYQLNANTKKPHRMYHIQSELHLNILSVFEEAGIEITAPKYVTLENKKPSPNP
jgi:small-conductance mechanosensitive channel